MTIQEVLGRMDFIGGIYLHSKALPRDGIIVTIKEIKTEMLVNPKTFKEEPKKVVYTEELGAWGFVLNAKCNRLSLFDMLKPEEKSGALIGKKITIYCDPEVKMKGKKVGAIRIK